MSRVQLLLAAGKIETDDTLPVSHQDAHAALEVLGMKDDRKIRIDLTCDARRCPWTPLLNNSPFAFDNWCSERLSLDSWARVDSAHNTMNVEAA